MQAVPNPGNDVSYHAGFTIKRGDKRMKAVLLQALQAIVGLEARPSPVAGGTALFYHGKEFAHFHHANELDIRLTKTKIRELGLCHPTGSVHHPQRSANSAWLEVRFTEPGDIAQVKRLVEIAISEL